jgi:hypothetical protein
LLGWAISVLDLIKRSEWALLMLFNIY